MKISTFIIFCQVLVGMATSCYQADNSTNCTIVATSELLFCKNEACSELYTTAPIIYLNDYVFMLHRTIAEGLKTYKYSNSVITFVAEGLLKNTTLAAVTYNTGNATYKFKAPLAWTNLSIQASTQLESNDTIYGTSDTTCVQVDKSSTECPTCAAICKANNGDAPSFCDCQAVSSGYQLLVSFVLALFLF